jgi:predicted phosphodiesterase
MAQLRSVEDGDWLIVAGDVAERLEQFEETISLLSQRFARVIWAPGNHDLWTVPSQLDGLRGVQKYEALIAACRRYSVITPEDPYEHWRTSDIDVVVAPLFLLYDYTFFPREHSSPHEALAAAHKRSIVSSDEFLLHPDPYESVADWCRARVSLTQSWLAKVDSSIPLVLINHFPLVFDDLQHLALQDFALWCGTTSTANWHLDYNVCAVIYGHTHIRGTSWRDGVPFHS